MSTDTPEVFPADQTDYYYRFRISAIEKTKEEYNNIFKIIVENRASIFGKVSFEESRKIFEKIEVLKDNFNNYADMLINKDGINSCKDFSYHMENLMLVANEAILYCEENIVLNDNVNLKQKFKYDDTERNLKFIISRLKNIPYDLNLDEPINVITNRFQLFIVFLIIFIVVMGGIVVLSPIILDLNSYNYINNFYADIFDLEFDYMLILISMIIILPSIYLYFYITRSKGYRLTDTKSYVYSKIKNIVYKPYKTDKRKYKYFLKALKYVFSYFKS